MNKLSQSTIEKLGYYVYLLIDPRTSKPFYVGKGIGNRINHHLLDALVKEPDEKLKIKTILDIQQSGSEVELVILRHGLTEKEAFEVEGAVIDLLRQDLTNLVSGHHATERGVMKLQDIKIKYEAEVAEFDEPAILITVNKLYKPDMSADDLYKITRSAWKISESKANSIKLVCAVYRGIIREVYVADKWQVHPDRNGRLYFDGSVAPEAMRSKYLFKSVKQKAKQGAANPIKYVGLKKN